MFTLNCGLGIGLGLGIGFSLGACVRLPLAVGNTQLITSLNMGASASNGWSGCIREISLFVTFFSFSDFSPSRVDVRTVD